MPGLDDLFTVAEAAAYLKKTEATIRYHLYTSGYLKGEIKGHDVLFTRAELDEFSARLPKRGRQPDTNPDGTRKNPPRERKKVAG